MDENEMENETPTNEEEETPETPEENGETPNNEPDVEELRKKAELAENYKTRAEKAEKKLKEKKETAPQEQNRLSDEDLLYIAKTDIHSDDLSSVREYAEKMGKTVKEAHEFLKPVFEKREAERKSAEVTNTDRQPRGDNKIKPAEVLAKASKGQLPSEDDDAGIQALVQAEMAARKKD